LSTRYRNFGSSLTKAGVPTSGVYQVETAVIVGTITLAGNMSVTVTAAGMAGSPKTLSVAVALNDTDAQVAAKVRAALAVDADIAAMFSVGGTGANVSLTALQSAANDVTLNIAYDNDTCTGLTGDAASNNTTAGVKGDYKGVVTGNCCLDTTNHDIYENTGDDTRPVWTLV
jgi:phage tail sheath gpL-like